MSEIDDQSEEVFNDVLRAVSEQMANPSTRYVRECFVRLIEAEGLAAEQAQELIANCLVEVCETMRETGDPFDEEEYRDLLDQLPDAH